MRRMRRIEPKRLGAIPWARYCVPVTLYYEQWVRLLDASEDLRAFLENNKDKLKLKQK